MEDFFSILSSSARLNKSRKRARPPIESAEIVASDNHSDEESNAVEHSRDRTGKRDTSESKRKQVHQEQVAAFRRSMSIRVADKHDPNLADPISSFQELRSPQWWTEQKSFEESYEVLQRNIEKGRWKEPTPIQMQSLPVLLDRRDLIGAAPTGSGKSGAFIIPSLLLGSASFASFYGSEGTPSKKKRKKKKNTQQNTKQGEIRSLLLAPARELAVQLHREVERIGMGKPGGIHALLLSKSNASHVIAGTAGGKHGLDVLVSTPLRLVDAVEKGLRLDSVRIIVLDEADRLLDAADGASHKSQVDSSDEEEDDVEENRQARQSGSSQTQSFLAQMDAILSAIPTSAVRALFSATVTPTVKSLAETILRNPVDLKIAAPGSYGGANTDIEQELMFVGREEGKLLAMRQLKNRGQLKPPAIVFVQSKDRAQALFSELLYEDMNVDVIHAGRSKSARDNAVARFRKGETWVLISTDLVARGVDFRAVNMVINYDLPTSGITYVHRIGRTGRAGRKGKAITLFTEADFENLRTIANVMKQSGCKVDEWMLQLKKSNQKHAPKRRTIDTTPSYDKKKKRKKRSMVEHSKKQSKS